MSVIQKNSQKVNYQIVLDKILEEISTWDRTPTLLLHVCCAPCASYVLEYLSSYFLITILFYNPNIYPEKEYYKRFEEATKLLEMVKYDNPIKLLSIPYSNKQFYDRVAGFENEKEGGKRCGVCFELRQEKAAQYAADNGYDFFSSSLTISPHKNAQLLNKIGHELEEKYNIRYLYSDFKKKNGYKRSVEIAKEVGLYRQDYCGCEYSLKAQKEKILDDSKS